MGNGQGKLQIGAGSLDGFPAQLRERIAANHDPRHHAEEWNEMGEQKLVQARLQEDRQKAGTAEPACRGK